MHVLATQYGGSTTRVLALALHLLLGFQLVGCSVSEKRFEPRAPIGEEHAKAHPISNDNEAGPQAIRNVSYKTQKYGGATFNDPSCIAIPVVTAVAAKPTVGMTLDEFESMALQYSPTIQQAAALANKAEAIQWQVGLKPNPTIGYFAEEIGNSSAAGLHGAFLSQTFVRGDKLAWNRKVHGHDVQSARWRAEVQRTRVRNDIRQKFFDALGAQKRLDLTQRFRIVAEKGVEATRALVAAQEGAKADILQSEVQLSEVVLAIQQTQFEFDAAWNELVSLAGVPEIMPSTLIGDLAIAGAKQLDMESTYRQLLEQSPQLAAASAQVRRALANVERQRVQPIPNLNAQVGAGYNDSTGDEFANVQLSIPIPVHNKNQGNICAAYADYVAATHNVNR